jgi:glycosyltransferase involved in cell wall biosynthesis
LASGLPCIAFDCETGPRHLIQHEKNGFLVNEGDIKTFGERMQSLMSNHDQRNAMSEQAKRSSLRFTPATIYEKWDKLITGEQQ